jgi:hypothetical protein
MIAGCEYNIEGHSTQHHRNNLTTNSNSNSSGHSSFNELIAIDSNELKKVNSSTDLSTPLKNVDNDKQFDTSRRHSSVSSFSTIIGVSNNNERSDHQQVRSQPPPLWSTQQFRDFVSLTTVRETTFSLAQKRRSCQ